MQTAAVTRLVLGAAMRAILNSSHTRSSHSMKQMEKLYAEIDMLGFDGKQFIPAFWEEVATLDRETGIITIGRSMVNPFVFHFFTKEKDGPNNSYVATVNFHRAIADAIPVIEQLLAEFKEGQHHGDGSGTVE
jgi:hypothetical protein